MANKKISALALIAGAAISATDFGPLVDADAVTPTTYKATMAEQRSALLKASGAGWDATDYLTLGGGTPPASGMVRSAQGAITADSPLINSTATWNAGGVTFRHLLVNITDTASAAGSLFADFQVGGVSKFSVRKDGAGVFAERVTGTGTAGNAGMAFKAIGRPATNDAYIQFFQNDGTTQTAQIGADATTVYVIAGVTNAITIAAATRIVTATSGLVVSAGGLAVTGLATFNTSATVTGAITATAQVITPDVASNSGATPLTLHNGATLVATFATTGLTIENAGALSFTAAVSQIVPGATSFSLRNTANNADNLLITNAGAVTFRSTVGGITTLTATTLAGTLSTAAQPNITSLGTLGALAVGPTLAAGTYGAIVNSAAGSSRDILQVGHSGFSLGLTVQSIAGTRMEYTLNDGNLTVTGDGFSSRLGRLKGNFLHLTGTTITSVSGTEIAIAGRALPNTATAGVLGAPPGQVAGYIQGWASVGEIRIPFYLA